ncbi:MAG: glycosyltransferase [Mucilaginibacter sp.]|jgi:glycosyltransferase involved in cell wall biosynthesis
MQDNRRLLFVIPTLLGGGAERVLIALANHFSNLGYICIIVSLNRCLPAYSIEKNVKVHYLVNRTRRGAVMRLWYQITTLAKLIGYMLTYRPVCCIAFITSANIWTAICSKLTASQYVLSERTSPERSFGSLTAIKRMIIGWLYKGANAVVVGSAGAEETMRKMQPFRQLKNLFKINNAVSSFPQPGITPVHGRKFILGVGRLNYVKGFDILINAFAFCQTRDIDLLIVGEGEERANLICDIYNLGLRGRVFLVGRKTNLQDYYSQAELFVLPSRNEGYPNALVEAMSFGCPCVAMNCDFGPAEIITNGENGILVNSLSANHLSNAIDNILLNDKLKSSIGFKAQNINRVNSVEVIFKAWGKIILPNYNPQVPLVLNLK